MSTFTKHLPQKLMVFVQAKVVLERIALEWWRVEAGLLPSRALGIRGANNAKFGRGKSLRATVSPLPWG